MQEKTVHIVFQVLNFLHSEASAHLKLLDCEKLLLINLASHKGPKGIYPSVRTIARELKKGESSVRRLISNLKKNELISIEFVSGKSNHYTLLTPLTHERGMDLDPSHAREDPPLTHERGTPLTHERLSTNINNKEKNRERARKSRAPLSPSFFPDVERTKKLAETAVKVGRSAEELLTKFKNLQLSKQTVSADWNAELENFLINERPLSAVRGVCSPVRGVNEIRSAVQEWGPGHPAYDRLHAPKPPPARSNGHQQGESEYVTGRYIRRKADG